MSIQVITDSNDLYTYFEVIRQLKPSTILDIGMTLKRAGAVARQIAGSEMDPSIRLTGVDFYPEFHLPVYNVIYNEILDSDNFFNSLESLPHYDLGILLDLSITPTMEAKLLAFQKRHTNYFFSNILHAENQSTRTLQIEDRSYFFFQN